MTTLLTILIVLAAIALILIVLVQKSKGGGLSTGFSSSNAIMGVRKTTDFLERATWGLAGTIIILSILVVVITPKSVTNTQQVNVPVSTPNSTTAPEMTPESELPILPSTPPAKTEDPAE